MNAGRVTVVIEYPDAAALPPFSAGMEALGGHVVAVQFTDALAGKDDAGDVFRLRATLAALLAHASRGGPEEQIITTALTPCRRRKN